LESAHYLWRTWPFGWGIVFNAQYYKEFLQLSLYRNHLITPKPTDPYYNEYNQYKAANVSDQAIYDAKDGYRRNRDLCILGALAFWGINTIDAYIDAKFIHSYTLDNNFSMRITPGLINQPTIYAQNPVGSYIPGIKLPYTLIIVGVADLVQSSGSMVLASHQKIKTGMKIALLGYGKMGK